MPLCDIRSSTQQQTAVLSTATWGRACCAPGGRGAGWAPVTLPPGPRSTAPPPRSASASGAYLIIASQVSGLKSLSPYGCAIPDFPDMYTSLAYYRDWILDTMAS